MVQVLGYGKEDWETLEREKYLSKLTQRGVETMLASAELQVACH